MYKQFIFLLGFLLFIPNPFNTLMAAWLDFAHPIAPHLDPATRDPNVYLTVDELMTDDDIIKELPVLVVLLEFDDSSSQPQHDAAFYSDMIFGQFRLNGMPSVAEVYDRLSNGRLRIVPAKAGDNLDGQADGIVGWVTAQSQSGCCKIGPDPIKLDVESCILQGNTWTSGSKAYYDCWIQEKRAEGVRQADALFDYWHYDSNAGNGLITGDELAIIVINADPNSAFSGNSRRTDPKFVQVEIGSGSYWVYQFITGVAEGPEVSLLAHEIGHTAFGMGDLYPACNTSQYRDVDQYGCDTDSVPDGIPDVNYPPDPNWYSLMTWSSADFVQQYLDPWHALHLGFIRAQVVDHDGIYRLYNVETNRQFSKQTNQPEAIIIHDPLKPSPLNDYFLLENRNETIKNGNGVDITDIGLAIWLIKDDGDTNRRKVLLKRRGGFWANPATDTLWDGSSSASTYDLGPLSTPHNSDWADGTKSYVEIYDISPAGTIMSFKVRMPPLFVDSAYVNIPETGYQDTPFNTLTEAIEAVPVPPRTIRMSGGIYNETLTISKPVTLMGWKNGDVFIGSSF